MFQSHNSNCMTHHRIFQEIPLHFLNTTHKLTQLLMLVATNLIIINQSCKSIQSADHMWQLIFSSCMHVCSRAFLGTGVGTFDYYYCYLPRGCGTGSCWTRRRRRIVLLWFVFSEKSVLFDFSVLSEPTIEIFVSAPTCRTMVSSWWWVKK